MDCWSKEKRGGPKHRGQELLCVCVCVRECVVTEDSKSRIN